MNERERLLHLLDYDFWATLQWKGAVSAINGDSVIAHMVAAQEVWLGRCKGTIEAHPEEPLWERVFLAYQGWRNYLAEVDLHEEITYQNLREEEFKNTAADIAHHVINHGTYHRGDLRGRCAALGVTSFPETDYIVFLRTQ